MTNQDRFRIVPPPAAPASSTGGADDDGAGRSMSPGRGRRLITPEAVTIWTTLFVGAVATGALLAIVAAAWKAAH